MLRMRHKQPDGEFMARTAGVSFRNLSAHGFGGGADYQKNVANSLLAGFGAVRDMISKKKTRIDILRNFEGLVHAGEMLVVLGPPGSGCSTFLKTLAGETHGFKVDKSHSDRVDTDRYRPLTSFSQKLKFLIDIQIAIFDKLHEVVVVTRGAEFQPKGWSHE